MPHPRPQRYHGRTRSAKVSQPLPWGPRPVSSSLRAAPVPLPIHIRRGFLVLPTRGAGVSCAVCIFLTMTAGAHRATLLACLPLARSVLTPSGRRCAASGRYASWSTSTRRSVATPTQSKSEAVRGAVRVWPAAAYCATDAPFGLGCAFREIEAHGTRTPLKRPPIPLSAS